MSSTNSIPKLHPKLQHRQAEYYAQLFRRLYPEIAAKCNGRIERAIEICCKPFACRPGHSYGVFEVQSESNPRGFYEVDFFAKTCTCPDAGKHPDVICKHRLAIGFQLRGHEWDAFWQLKQIKTQGNARRAMEAARDKVKTLSDQLENMPLEMFDADETQQLHSALIEATEIAQDLEQKYHALAWEKP